MYDFAGDKSLAVAGESHLRESLAVAGSRTLAAARAPSARRRVRSLPQFARIRRKTLCSQG